MLLSMVFGMLAMLMPFSAYAADIRTEDGTIGEDETIDDDLYIFSDEVEVEGIVVGDLIASGGNVEVSGNVMGDLYVTGGMVSVSGNIDGSIYAAGGQVEISGIVGRSIISFGGQVRILSDASVFEDVVACGGQVSVDGFVGDDLRAAGGSLDIKSEVRGDAIVSGGDVKIDEDKVAGDVEKNVDMEKTTKSTKREVEGFGRASSTFNIIANAAVWVGMFVVGAVLIWLAPVKTKIMVEKISASWSEFFMSLLYGFLGSIVLGVGSIVLIITLIGMPLGGLIIGFLAFVAWIGVLWADMAVGRSIVKLVGVKDDSYYISLLAGRVLSLVIGWIPCVNLLYGYILFLVVLGAVIRNKMDLLKKGRRSTAKKAAPKSKKK